MGRDVQRLGLADVRAHVGGCLHGGGLRRRGRLRRRHAARPAGPLTIGSASSSRSRSRASPPSPSPWSVTSSAFVEGDRQPSKLAAFELAETTEQPAPLRLGGMMVDGEARYYVEIPKIGSLIARNSFDKPVPGLDTVPADERPPVTLTHLAFQTMVGIGTLLALSVLVFWYLRRRGRDLLAGTLVPALRRRRGAAGRRRARGGLDRDRGRPPAMGGLRRASHQRRGRRQPVDLVEPDRYAWSSTPG